MFAGDDGLFWNVLKIFVCWNLRVPCQAKSGSCRCFSSSIAPRRYRFYGFVKPLWRCDCLPMLFVAFAHGMLAPVRDVLDARPERAYLPVRARFGSCPGKC